MPNFLLNNAQFEIILCNIIKVCQFFNFYKEIGETQALIHNMFFLNRKRI